jgi:hypothetical protein
MILFQIRRKKWPTRSAAGRHSQVKTAALAVSVVLVAHILCSCSS